jgi:hypothetical protein
MSTLRNQCIEYPVPGTGLGLTRDLAFHTACKRCSMVRSQALSKVLGINAR